MSSKYSSLEENLRNAYERLEDMRQMVNQLNGDLDHIRAESNLRNPNPKRDTKTQKETAKIDKEIKGTLLEVEILSISTLSS